MKGEKISKTENLKKTSKNTDLCKIFNSFFSNIKQHYLQNDLDSEKNIDSVFTLEVTYPNTVLKINNNLNKYCQEVPNL